MPEVDRAPSPFSPVAQPQLILPLSCLLAVVSCFLPSCLAYLQALPLIPVTSLSFLFIFLLCLQNQLQIS